MTIRIWRTGEKLRIQYGEHHTTGTVVIASSNGRSLMLSFDAMLGGYLGTMPVLADEADIFRDLINAQPVTLADLER